MHCVEMVVYLVFQTCYVHLYSFLNRMALQYSDSRRNAQGVKHGWVTNNFRFSTHNCFLSR